VTSQNGMPKLINGAPGVALVNQGDLISPM